jgi:hypothetical protein
MYFYFMNILNIWIHFQVDYIKVHKKIETIW